MVSLTMSVSEEFKAEIKHFSWVNWSELSREEALKKEIFDNFIKTGKLSKEEEKFCEMTNWDPIDELEVREEYVEKLKRLERGPHSSITLEELDKLMGLK